MLWPGIIPVCLPVNKWHRVCLSVQSVSSFGFDISDGNTGNITHGDAATDSELEWGFISIANDSQFSTPNSLINLIFVSANVCSAKTKIQPMATSMAVIDWRWNQFILREIIHFLCLHKSPPASSIKRNFPIAIFGGKNPKWISYESLGAWMPT